MNRVTTETNIRSFIIVGAVAALLMGFGSVITTGQTTCLTAQAIMEQKDTITQAEAVKQRDCWVAKLKSGEKKMAGAFLYAADLSASETNPAKYAKVDLTNANLAGADLYEADLSGATLNGADMTSARLRYANLRDAKMIGATLMSANLSRSALYRSDLTNADLRGADLADCGFNTHLEVFSKNQSELGWGGWERLPAAERRAINDRIQLHLENMESVKLKGAKISSNTQGVNIEIWKKRGGVVVE
ncbi:MAG: pentapeptide repeat-containing protein [Pyrinomonadaceae bacterium]|nr:pentapeptide repeat-containing protein [Pyrinomonadaceae bacterium]